MNEIQENFAELKKKIDAEESIKKLILDGISALFEDLHDLTNIQKEVNVILGRLMPHTIDPLIDEKDVRETFKKYHDQLDIPPFKIWTLLDKMVEVIREKNNLPYSTEGKDIPQIFFTSNRMKLFKDASKSNK